MSTYKLGDRVAYYERPHDCGTIVAVLDYGDAGLRYLVDLGQSRSESYLGSDLVPCVSAHTPRA